MAKRNSLKLGDRDIEMLSALDRCVLTAEQMAMLSESFVRPFSHVGFARRRLRQLAHAGYVRAFSYALASNGRSPNYFRLTRTGWQTLHGVNVELPRRRQFEAIADAHHHHTLALSDVIVHLAVTAHRAGVELREFWRENSLQIASGDLTLRPDCAFQLRRDDRRPFHFVVELDCSTERLRTPRNVESIQRKIRGYDRHQGAFDALDPQRYLVLFITTRSRDRLDHILELAADVMANPERAVFIGATLSDFLGSDPFHDAVLRDHRGLKRMIIPADQNAATSQVVDGVASALRRERAASQTAART
ncbi:MAG: replication-relaxation family protein [Rhodopirellula sp.]|nr:replication-relaxation family protein [Rhodopirellula sp.]